MAPSEAGRQRPVMAIANRLPVVKGRDGTWRPADGGLVTALRPVLERRGGAWVGWDGGSGDAPPHDSGLNIDLHAISLTRRQIQDYYHGFSNRTLWPLLHDLIEQPVFRKRWWQSYSEVNRLFADVALQSLPGKDPFIWVHDYLLMLLPGIFREARPSSRVAFFLHTPFPSPEVFTRLPWRREIIRGLLGSDLIGFHTPNYQDNFLDTCRRLLDDVKVESDRVITWDGRVVRTGYFPISIDAAEFAEAAKSPKVERELARLRLQFRDKRVLLGVDRLDYTKGILERLRAVEMLLDRRPELARTTVFVQVAVPSRDDVREYRELRAEVEREVGRINGRFTEPGFDVPVLYMYRSLPRDRMLAYYRLADVALITPLKDGMNLVAKEFVVSQAAGRDGGAVVLSEFAGAAEELTAAVMCNPFDIDQTSEAIERALEMTPEERKQRIEAMAGHVHRRDVLWWVKEILAAAESASDPA